MGSYAGSSDWDELPASGSLRAFKPAAVGADARGGAGAAGGLAGAAAGAAAGAGPGASDATPAGDESEGQLEGSPEQRKRLNAIFAFDTTGSMTPWVENVQKMEYLAAGLLRLLDTEIAFVGVGDHGDGRNMLQLKYFSADVEQLQRNIRELRPTDGGDTPEAFECLFRVLGSMDYAVATVLVLVTDSIPHGMEGWTGDDDGCPLGVDYREELDELRRKLKKVYLVSCAEDAKMLALQRQLVGENAFLRLSDFRRLTNLLMAICMDEVGDLDYFMGILEAQRGPQRRHEVLQLLGRG